MTQEIIIDIDEVGNTRFEVNGVVGPDCAALTREIEQAIGGTPKQVRKADYYKRVVLRKVGA